MKKILLVNPWIEDVSAFDFWLKPVGLLYVASMIRQAGYEVDLIDCLDRYDDELLEYTGGNTFERFCGAGNFYNQEIPKPVSMKMIPRRFKRYGIPEELLRNKLRKIGGVEGIFVSSMMTYWHYGVSDTIRVIHEELPGVPVILGGVYASLMSEHARRYSGADLVTPGTGMEPVKKAMEYIGLELEIRCDWLCTLEPAYDLYKNLKYIVLITSTGCPYRCSYCSGWRLWEKYSNQDPEITLHTIKKYAGVHKLEDIVFFDDAILVGDHFRKLLRLLEKENLNLRFHLPNGIHARYVDEELAALMKSNNFKTIRLGYETSDEEVQKKTGGKVTNSDFEKAVGFLRSAGFTASEISAYVLINLPGQSQQSVEDSLYHCEELGITPSINEFTPIPGTTQYNELVAGGSIPAEIDPLLLDNSVIPHWWSEGFSAIQVDYLKRIATNIKRRLINDGNLSRIGK